MNVSIVFVLVAFSPMLLTFSSGRRTCGVTCLRRFRPWVSRIRRLPAVDKLLREKQPTDFLQYFTCTDSEKSRTRIVGGVATTIDKLPYQASVELKGRHFCGGAIISTVFVVTAGHCIEDGNNGDLAVRVGSTFRERGGMLIDVEETIMHEDYDGGPLHHDIGLIKLEKPLVFDVFVTKIRILRNPKKVKTGNFGIVSGWGRTSTGGALTSELRKVTLPVVEHQMCVDIYTEENHVVTPYMLCAGYMGMGGMDACQGDSGGPFAIDNRLVGIVSWGGDCADKKFPGVYTNVAMYWDWIYINTENTSLNCGVECLNYEYPWNTFFRRIPPVEDGLDKNKPVIKAKAMVGCTENTD